MTKQKEELFEALNRIDQLASEMAQDNNYGEAEQLDKDYNLLFKFIENS